MSEKPTRAEALLLRRKVDALELDNLLKTAALNVLRAETTSLSQLVNFFERQTEDAALRVFRWTDGSMRLRDEAYQRARVRRYALCDELRRVIVDNVMHRLLDVVSTLDAVADQVCSAERPPRDRWRVPSPVLGVEATLVSYAFNLTTVSRLVDEQLAATAVVLGDSADEGDSDEMFG